MAMPSAENEVEAVERTHSVFDGNKVSAIQAFNTCRRHPRLAKIASRGTLLVDTGACSSVCKPEAFQTAALNTKAVEELYTVDDTPLKACWAIRPRLRLADQHKEETHVTFQVVQRYHG